MASDMAEPILISAIQHAVYCLRQAALIHLERIWEENRFTAEGNVLHAQVDKPGARHQRGVRRVSALPIESNCLGIAGVADLVEYSQDATGETAYPVEFKRGKPKAHRADQAQLCAQALCLEEMTGRPVPEGALFYAETKRRTPVMFDAELRRLTIDAIIALTQVFASRLTPPPTSLRSRCRACSLSEACRPDLAGKNVRAWRRRMVEITANEGAA